MKYIRKYLKLTIIFVVILMIISGCNSSSIIDTVVPEINPNPDTNPVNNTLSYIKMTPSSSTIKTSQSLQLVVKGYNSDDEWVILDKSKVILWKWTVKEQCYDCVEPYVTLTPKSGSLSTTFTSGVTGTFYVVVYYQENTGAEYITDYVEIMVTK